MFLDNRYKRIYDRLCARAIGRIVAGYTEKHHIIPKSLGGSNRKDNIVQLTAREHYIAHLCLVCCTEGPTKAKMLNAVRYLITNTTHTDRKFNSHLFGNLRQHYADSLKGNQRGLGNFGNLGGIPWNKGLRTPPETRFKQRAAKLGKTLSAEHKERIRLSMLGKQNALGYHHTALTKTAIGQSLRNNTNALGFRKSRHISFAKYISQPQCGNTL